MSRHSHMDLAGDILVACFKLSHFHHQLDFWNYQRNLCLMALLYCLGFNSCFFFSFRRGLLATSLFCKARGLWGRLVRQSPRGELSVESSRVRADSSVSCLSSLPLWPSLTPLSPLIAVTIVILCVLPAGFCNPPPPHTHRTPTLPLTTTRRQLTATCVLSFAWLPPSLMMDYMCWSPQLAIVKRVSLYLLKHRHKKIHSLGATHKNTQ